MMITHIHSGSIDALGFMGLGCVVVTGACDIVIETLSLLVDVVEFLCNSITVGERAIVFQVVMDTVSTKFDCVIGVAGRDGSGTSPLGIAVCKGDVSDGRSDTSVE